MAKSAVNEKNTNRILLSGILIITAIVYLKSLSNGFFCWDDKVVPLAPLVQHLSFTNFIKYFTSFHAGLYHPLTTLSFAIDYAIGKGSAFPFHLTNLIIHLFNVALVFILVRKLLSEEHFTFRHSPFALSIFASIVALLMGIHPMHVEAVAWITSRKDLLYVLFFLGAMIAYLGYLDKGDKNFFYLTLLLFLFSTLCKIQAAVFPLVLFLIDYLRNRKLFTPGNLMEKVPFLVIAILFGIINIIAQKGYGYIDYKADYSLFERIILFCYGFARYIFLLFVPYPDSVFYPFPFKPGASPSPVFFLYPLVLGVFLGTGLYAFRKSYKEAVFGLAFFFVGILLVLLINNYRETIITDRYTYLASLGIFLFLAWTSLKLITQFPSLKRVIYILAAIYMLGLAYLNFERNRLWHSPQKLMGSALSLYPNSPILLNTLGSLAIDSGSNALALEYLNKAVSLDGKFAQAWYNRGIAESKSEMYQFAVRDFTTAISLNQAYADAYFGRGNAYRITGVFEEALKDYSYVLKLDPGYFGAWQNRAIVKGNIKDFNGAIEDLDQAIRINADFGASYFLRGVAKFETGQNGCDDLHKAVYCNYEPALKALEYYCK